MEKHRNDPQYWIEQLSLEKHPEGGYYRETYRSEQQVEGRDMTTNIYYLLPSHTYSRFHRLKFDEFWYFHYGSPMHLYCFSSIGGFKEYILGDHPGQGQQLSLRVPGGTIFGGEVAEKDSFILLSCNMSPGFHFEDFEIFGQDELLNMYPDYKALIEKFC